MTGHHIDREGRFQSDKYPDLPPDKVVISLHDPLAWTGLTTIGLGHLTDGDAEFGQDLVDRVRQIRRKAIS